ncbi:metallophosphoesterase [Actinokineospora sp. NBRC 105648]|uniref:metallophosphoesterase n=1 Tax=Actinokineospora sp. NBRC 105648 TaxID=3032206 RepID=UPI0024A5D791|nr:metallophosphoesterase [Actinokineospora sp. NBRC 105648]GLZ38334.1 metallophosphatase [Actinokineospora sp. NBRC 105648]
MFVVVVGLGVALLHLYLWKRLVKDTTRTTRVRRAGTVVLGLLLAFALAALTLPRVVGVPNSGWFAWPGYLWLAVFFYLLLILAVLELPRLALRKWLRAPRADQGAPEVDESRRLFLSRAGAVVAGAASTSIVGAGAVTALSPPEVKRLAVPISRLDPGLRGFRIAVVSDIHLGPLLGRAHTERIVRMINETRPDLVAMVGDLADGTVAELGRAAEPLKDLVSPHGTYFVTGNHEYYSGYQEWVTELERLGLHYLHNENTKIAGGITLAGVTDVTGKSMGDAPDMDRALSGRDSALPTVMLAHQPVQVAGAASRGVDLQLSGHTHGGQLFPFHYVVRMAQPAVSGLSKVDNTWLYVTNGAGSWGPPVRVGAPPDITVVELTP